MSDDCAGPCLSLEGTRPVIQMIITGKLVEPDRWDDLPAEIRFATDCLRDPWCPAFVKPLLMEYIEKANAILSTNVIRETCFTYKGPKGD